MGRNRGLLQMWDCHDARKVQEIDFDELPDGESKRGMIMGVDAFRTSRRNKLLVVLISESSRVDVYDVRPSKYMFSQQVAAENTSLTCMVLNQRKQRGLCAGTDQ